MPQLTQADLAQLSAQAAAAPRLRSNSNFHAELADPIQRLAIAMEPGTYVRPHRHRHSFEMLTVLTGAMEWIGFDDDGVVTARHRLGEGGLAVFEFPSHTWHSVIALTPGSVVFEVKAGPYQPLAAEDQAAWSPAEGSADVPRMLDFLSCAQVGARYEP